MSTEQNKALVRRYVEEVSNRTNLAAIDELIADDYTHHSDSGVTQDVRGPELIRQNVARDSAGFSNLHFQIEDMIAEGDRVVYRWTATATHTGAFKDAIATGKAVTMPGITILRIDRDKIAERWGSADMWGLMQQIGALSSP
jgi:steroid delta-isomerase-like uncharacterized protein